VIKRSGWVSNSSSTSFIIENKTKNPLTVKDFAQENLQVLRDFNKEYDYNFTEKEFLESAGKIKQKIKPGPNVMEFGDNHGLGCGEAVGHVFDYQLRCGGESKRFRWEFKEMNR